MKDIVIISIIKIILIVGFIYLIKLWHKRKQGAAPKWTYWLLGLFFIFIQFDYLITVILMTTIYDSTNMLTDSDSIGSMSALMSLIIYFYLGLTIFKKKKFI